MTLVVVICLMTSQRHGSNPGARRDEVAAKAMQMLQPRGESDGEDRGPFKKCLIESILKTFIGFIGAGSWAVRIYACSLTW